MIKFKKKNFYVQRQINNLFHFYREFAKIYINDIVIFNKIFEKYLKYFVKSPSFPSV